MSKRVYIVNVTFTTDDAHADEHLKDEQSVHDEIVSWLESLGARIDDLSVYGRSL